MGKKQFKIVVFLAVLLAMALPGVTLAQEPVTGSPNFVFVNFIGQQMNLDLDDTSYLIPGIDTAPDGGRLELTLPAGEHKYAANIAGRTGAAGEFTLVPGGAVAKAARFEMTPPRVEQGILIEEPKEYVYVFDFDPTATPAEPSPVIDAWQPAPAAPGQGSLVWVNYQGDELTIDMSGQLYKVAPQANNIPGRLQLDVTPGQHDYTASVPHGSYNGQIVVEAGQVIGLSVSADLPEAPKYDVGQSFDTTPPVVLHVFPENLTAQAVAPAATPVEAVPPVTVEAAAPVEPAAAITPAGLLVRNFTGDTLIFTINNTAYPITANSEQRLDVPPGDYTYTASLPYIATTGEVTLGQEAGIALSVATNVAHDVLNVYQINGE
jgi:hypothetical protein